MAMVEGSGFAGGELTREKRWVLRGVGVCIVKMRGRKKKRKGKGRMTGLGRR
jgi:hypothetical protein